MVSHIFFDLVMLYGGDMCHRCISAKFSREKIQRDHTVQGQPGKESLGPLQNKLWVGSILVSTSRGFEGVDMIQECILFLPLVWAR